ncbi:MAG: ADP-ribosylglycohydrolase family protein [Bacteroidota bacterium]
MKTICNWMSPIGWGWLLFIGLTACEPIGSASPPGIWTSAPDNMNIPMEDSLLYDRILASLIGSAIGDAMGAPTEMWSRSEIQAQYGFVAGLEDMVRAPSPEGTWAHNLPAGGTTDDTRWKHLMADFLSRNQEISAQTFAKHIVSSYQTSISDLQGRDGKEIGLLESDMHRIQWLREWALVGKPFLEEDHSGYQIALSKFYGGEMVCAGMLFSPVLGMINPGNPVQAYLHTREINLFDIGYAQDISGLTASLVAAAMVEKPSQDSVWKIFREVDPHGYFDSRLVGRSAYKWFENARRIAYKARQAKSEEILADPPVTLMLPLKTLADSIQYAQWAVAYSELDKLNMTYPFHPAEIYLINLTALMLCEFDFMKTLQFIVNYGRDNDTVAAVAGAILGAFHGTAGIPRDWQEQVLRTQIEMGIDLKAMAHQLLLKAQKGSGASPDIQ